MRKMIIIGSSNNFNELGLVRSFGVNGIKPYGIIIVIRNNGNMIGYINRNIGQNAIGWILEKKQLISL